MRHVFCRVCFCKLFTNRFVLVLSRRRFSVCSDCAATVYSYVTIIESPVSMLHHHFELCATTTTFPVDYWRWRNMIELLLSWQFLALLGQFYITSSVPITAFLNLFLPQHPFWSRLSSPAPYTIGWHLCPNVFLLPLTATCVAFPSTPWNCFQRPLGVLAPQVKKPCPIKSIMKLSHRIEIRKQGVHWNQQKEEWLT